VAKRYCGRGEEGGEYETETFAQADDFADADGISVLTYFQAMQKLGAELSEVQRRDRYTVNDAVDDYISWLKLHRKSARDAEVKLRAYLVKYFDGREVSSLTPGDFEKWLAWAHDHKPPGRRKDKSKHKAAKRPPTAAAKGRVASDATEVKRRRRSTMNRVINTAKACLNRAFLTGHTQNDAGWRRLRRFKNADAARIQWLTIEQAGRLMNACAADFRQIVQAGLLTGARWSELRALKVRDYDPRSNTLLIAESKSNKSRRIPLTDEGAAAFESWTAGRGDEEILLRRADGDSWGLQDQKRRMIDACTAGSIKPVVGFHALRHTYASALVQEGVSLAIVAEALGHSDTRMVSKHYGHLAPSHVADAIRAKLPKLGIAVDTSVRRLRS
jgi:integrase